MDLAYLVGGTLAAPWLVRKSLRTGKYQSGLAARLGLGEEDLPTSPERAGKKVLLLHCVSVGELNSVQTLIARLLAADERLLLVVTTGTDTGTERARKLFPAKAGRRVFPVRFPFDFSFAVERLLERVRPDAVALVELETWPNFLEIAEDRRVPVVIINGRISEKSFPRYRLIRPVMAAMLRKVAWIGAQTETIAERFVALGAEARRVETIPTLKYDNAHLAEQVPGQEQLAAAMGLGEVASGQGPVAGGGDIKLLVGGSTGPGEEEVLLEMYGALRGQHPELRLAIVPRHPEVVAQVVAAIRRVGLTPVLRTERPDAGKPEIRTPKLETHEVFVLNTMGELRKIYALAFGVFVGRSLFKRGGGGSDMIEVAALGKPCCFGPYTANFAEVVEMLVSGGGAMEVSDAAGLTLVVADWLANAGGARAMGRNAQELIRGQQGSTDRYVEKLLQI